MIMRSMQHRLILFGVAVVFVIVIVLGIYFTYSKYTQSTQMLLNGAYRQYFTTEIVLVASTKVFLRTELIKGMSEQMLGELAATVSVVTFLRIELRLSNFCQYLLIITVQRGCNVITSYSKYDECCRWVSQGLCVTYVREDESCCFEGDFVEYHFKN